MLIGQQIIIQSTQNCYKVYRGRLGVVVDYNEIENYYLVWSNGTTIRLGEAEMSPLEAPAETAVLKFSLPELEVAVNESPATKFNEEYGAEYVIGVDPGVSEGDKSSSAQVGEAETPPAPAKKRGRPAKIQPHPMMPD